MLSGLSRRSFLKALSAGACFGIASPLMARAGWAGPARKPNIVYILADDMGYDSVSANNEKMGPLKTPHIDRLCSTGMNFTDAHSGSAVCSPTRNGLLTGRHCWRTALQKEVLWDYGRPLIEKDRLTVADLLDVPLSNNVAEDSTSILGLLTGKAESLPDRPMVVHHDYKGNFAIRKGKWKLVAGDRPSLFDLQADPKESRDVAGENEKVVKHMADTLKRYQAPAGHADRHGKGVSAATRGKTVSLLDAKK